MLTYRTGAGNAVTWSPQEPLISIPTTAAQHDAAVTDAAVAQVTRRTDALTPIVGSAAGKARELSHGSAAHFRTMTGMTLDAYRQTGHYLGDPTAWV